VERILFGDNQFFGVNHQSEEKERQQAMRFRDVESIMEVIDFVYDIGLRTFMCTTHERIAGVCDCLRASVARYDGFQIYPCMPYAHKYNNAVAEFGAIGALRRMLPGRIVSTMAKGGVAFVRRDYVGLMRLLVDTEMMMFRGIATPVIFLQNIVTDLLLGLGMTELLREFAEYVTTKYKADPGFITMNLPALLSELDAHRIGNIVICTSINKIGFRMPGGRERYEKSIASSRHRIVAMQTLAAGALPPREAIEYVCRLPGITSILFGASTKDHIRETKRMIELLSS
jgi:hypothetical protein